MAIEIGCFALLEPFSTLDRQLEWIRGMGFRFADVTDNTDGACLGVEFGFTAVASLDAHPPDLKRLFDRHGLGISSFCAHASLLDPPAPWRYGTMQIIKAVRLAAALGVRHVITTDGHPQTPLGQGLGEKEALLLLRDRLYEPLRMAADLGVRILLESHGPFTATADRLEAILDFCNSDALGLNLDTGNAWLGGEDPVRIVERLGRHIEHVHWKDIPADLAPRRGQVYGMGMTAIPLGTGVVDLRAVYDALVRAGFEGHSTLEVAGNEALLESRVWLQEREKETRRCEKGVDLFISPVPGVTPTKPAKS